MICFLTSRIDSADTGTLNPANRLIDELRRCFPSDCRALQICSDPDSREMTDYYAELTRKLFEDAGFDFERYEVLDGRNTDHAAELVRASNLLILSGGHVPTQNRFFADIRLREFVKDYNDVIIGISAGSMNCADTVYALPEENGEAIDPEYHRFLPGLGLTKTNLIPHYDDIRNDVLDGMRILDDIAFPDSLGRTFYAVPDGTYLLIDNGKEELRGEAYRIRNGVLTRITGQGELLRL